MFTRIARAALWLTIAGISLGGGTTLAAHDDHATPPAAMDAEEGHDHDHAAPTTPPTAEEQAAADQLVAATLAAAVRFEDFAVAEAEGYRRVTPLAPSGRGPAHYVNPAYVLDGDLLDPERPEALVYLHAGPGESYLLGVMFLAAPGDGPTPGGPLTRWHGHPGMCSGQTGIGPQDATGTCPPGQYPIRSEMLHVWTFGHPDGPLAARLGRDGLLAAIDQFGL